MTEAPPTGPALPAWVDPALEVTDTDVHYISPEQFVTAALEQLAALGCPRGRAIEVVAHCGTECKFGRRAAGNNLGGVKLSRTDVRAALREGHPLSWWRRAGHLEAGDGEVCYYRAFLDETAFWAHWLRRFVPRTAAAAERDRYIETGRLFWSTGDWFVAMLRAGYRGPVRQAELEQLVAAGRDPAEHRSVAAQLRAVAHVQRLIATEPA